MLSPAPDPKLARASRAGAKRSLAAGKARSRRPWENATVADLLDIAAAREIVLGEAARGPAGPAPLGAEPVKVDDALGRILAEDVASELDQPPFDSSAMDGYAVVAGSAAELPVIGESRAGAPAAAALAPGQAIRISTGAQLPEGADSVIPIERVEATDGLVSVPQTEPGANIRRAGEDVLAGVTVLRAGAELGPAELAVLASFGRTDVLCGRRPRVAILATGDELVPPPAPLGPGQIRDSNATALAALASRAGAEVVSRRHVADEPEATAEALREALAAAEVVCVSGGVSVGPHDHVKPALAELGVEERFWRVALRPGKPTWFGRHGERGALVFGLPGNPVSVIVTFHLFVRPALRRLAGGEASDTRARALLDSPLARNPKRDEVVRCRLEARDDGWHVRPTKEQGSHVLTSMVGADAFALIPRGEGEVAPGERVDIEILR
jgi:molybdopterin molybdotransferase